MPELIILLVIVGIPTALYILSKKARQALPSKKYICTTCGHVGVPKLVTKGSLGVEIFLWILFLVPGLIYSIWRHASRYKGCPSCNSSEVIPVDTPRGQELLAQYK